MAEGKQRTTEKTASNHRTLAESHRHSVPKVGKKSVIVKFRDELGRFGIRVMEIAASEVCNRVHTSHFASKWLMNKSVCAEFVPKPPRNLSSGWSIVPGLTAQIQMNNLRRERNTLIQQFEDVPVCSSHPRNHRRH
jgi:hypothetical protein